MDNYFNKYLKYKQKYIQLKYGGLSIKINNITPEIKNLYKIIIKEIVKIINNDTKESEKFLKIQYYDINDNDIKDNDNIIEIARDENQKTISKNPLDWNPYIDKFNVNKTKICNENYFCEPKKYTIFDYFIYCISYYTRYISNKKDIKSDLIFLDYKDIYNLFQDITDFKELKALIDIYIYQLCCYKDKCNDKCILYYLNEQKLFKDIQQSDDYDKLIYEANEKIKTITEEKKTIKKKK
jgi:hypothetical protein